MLLVMCLSAFIYVAIINGLFGSQKAKMVNIEVLHCIHVLFT